MSRMMTSISRELIVARRNIEFIISRLPSEERRLYKQFEALRSDYFNTYWHGVAGDIDAEISSVGYDFYRLQKKGRTTFVRYGEVMLDDHLTLDMAGNKPLVNRLLQEHGYPVPEFFEYRPDTITQALSFMEHNGGNFVVKPAVGSGGGRGITTKINCKRRLINASYKAAIHSVGNRLIIEKEHDGKNYRLLYLNGQFIDAIRRDAPGVTGDGLNSLKFLMQKENRRRLESREADSLSPLTLDLDALYTLSDKDLTFQHVPAAGKRVTVKTATNQYAKDENHSVRKSVHPSIIEYGKNISRVMNVTLSGVDMMMHHHEAPLEESGCIVNEINTTPGLHHHDLISSARDRVNVGALIADYILEQPGIFQE